jgi:hypothetical protein
LFAQGGFRDVFSRHAHSRLVTDFHFSVAAADRSLPTSPQIRSIVFAEIDRPNTCSVTTRERRNIGRKNGDFAFDAVAVYWHLAPLGILFVWVRSGKVFSLAFVYAEFFVGAFSVSVFRVIDRGFHCQSCR